MWPLEMRRNLKSFWRILNQKNNNRAKQEMCASQNTPVYINYQTV